MNRITRLIVENIPLREDKAILREDLVKNVKSDYDSLGMHFPKEMFDSSLQQLHNEQLIFVFINGLVKMTGMGRYRLR